MNNTYLLASIFKKSNELTLEYWEIYVSEDDIREDFRKITEIYIPELDIAINKEDQINIFTTTIDRYINKTTNMPKLIKKVNIKGDIVNNLRWFAKVRKEEINKKKNIINLFEK